MTRPLDRHLDEAEVEVLAAALETTGPGSHAGGGEAEDESASHLERCADCTRKVHMRRTARWALTSLKTGFLRERQALCPESVDWNAVAAGLLPPEQAMLLINHAARCAHCGPLLKMAADAMSDETTPEEEAVLASLDSSREPWQATTAQSLRDCSRSAAVAKPNKPVILKLRFLLPLAALVLVVAGTAAVFHFQRPPSAESLISQAYPEYRTLELRIPGAANAPMHLERGAGVSSLDRPGLLLQAESLISDGLRKSPNDMMLLDDWVRADLLDGNYEAAINTAQRALETEPNAAAILLDLGTAYYLRAEANGDDEHDYARAIESLSKVLAQSPNNSVALFNRAIAEEKAYLYERAEQDWKTFLSVERDPAWLAEGRQRSSSLMLRMQRKGQSRGEPAGDLSRAAAELHAHAIQASDTGWPKSLDEAYIQAALTDWISLAVLPDQGSAQRDSISWAALRALAEELSHRHGDDFLADLLVSSHSRAWLQGMRELSVAAQANALGDAAQGVVHAQRALEHFRRAPNRAGEAAGLLEMAQSLSSLQRGRECLSVGLRGLSASRSHHYPWVEAQIYYELSACSFTTSNPQQAVQFAKRGENLSESTGYAVLALGGKYYLDGVSTREVAQTDAWNRIRAGLQEYWQAQYPAESAAEFYVDLAYVAEMEQDWRFAEAANQESVLMREQGTNRIWLAASHQALAKDAQAAGDAALAGAEFEQAFKLRASWSRSDRAAQATLEIERASLEVRQRLFEPATVRLEGVKQSLSALGDESVALLYHESLGELYLRSGMPKLAEVELLEAVRLIENNKNSLSSENDFLSWQLKTSPVYRLLLEVYSIEDRLDARSLAFLEWYKGEYLRVDPQNAQRLASHPLGRLVFPGGTERELQEQLISLGADPPVVVWASFPSTLVIWELDEHGLYRAEVKVDANLLNATAARFSRLCADPKSDLNMLHRDARQLYEWLILPVAGRLPLSGALSVEPDSSFRSIAMQALEDASGKYLGQRFLISESAGMLYSRVFRASKAVSGESVMLAIGDPLFAAKLHGVAFRRLHDADVEAQEVASQFGNHYVLTGEQANVESVIKLLPRAEIFHFAGHAFAGPGAPALLLAAQSGHEGETAVLDQKRLRTADLRRLQMAVLSGCETAVADQGLVDPNSLVRLFLRAGVRHVVASKWRVNSQVSAVMMNHLYASLLQGDSVVASLAYSERIILSNSQTAHPYYWAAFSAFGG